MPGSGKHKAILSHQTSDGTFEIEVSEVSEVEDVEAAELGAEPSESIAAAGTPSVRGLRLSILIPAILLVITVIGVIAFIAQKSSNEATDETGFVPGFRPYSGAPNNASARKPKVVLSKELKAELEAEELEEEELEEEAAAAEEANDEEVALEIEKGIAPDEMEEGVEEIIEVEPAAKSAEILREGVVPQAPVVGDRLKARMQPGFRPTIVDPELLKKPNLALPGRVELEENVIEESEEIPDDVEVVE